jgi:hypothetical protein
MRYSGDSEFDDFIEYNDLGLPLAYGIINKFVESTPASNTLISETFDLLLEAQEIDEDAGYEGLDDLLGLLDE